MKSFLLGLAAAMLLSTAIPTQATNLPPADAVRQVSVRGDKYCSAVVIAPGKAITAQHCLQRYMDIDGLKATAIRTFIDDKDIAVVTVPGLKCPCVSLGVRPAKGDQVLAVGFPVNRDGERRISAVARVAFVGSLNIVLEDLPITEHYIITDSSIITHGDSGGALLAMQGGEWKLVGINAIGIPDPTYPCIPGFGCAGPEIASGFVPVDVAKEIL